jgi:putative transposase
MGQRSIEMSRRRRTPEQIVCKLREADRLLGEGMQLSEVWKQLEVSAATYHWWRTQLGGMKADDVKGLKALEVENAQLKRIVADQVLEVAALKEIAKGGF